MSAVDLSQVVNQYRAAYQQHGNSLKSIFVPKDRQDLRFGVLTARCRASHFSVLDYGCGLGHLKAYLDRKFQAFDYTGVDIVPEFIQENCRNFATGRFTEISTYADITGMYDYIFVSGVFNLMYSDSLTAQKTLIQDTLQHLFHHTRVYLAANFMTDQVDFQQAGAYHQNVAEIYHYLSHNLSPRLQLDQSYMPFEYTVIVYKNHEIVRPDLVYPEV